jgi:hypothetical protein
LGAEKLFSILLLGFVDVEIEEEEIGWAFGAEDVHDSFEGHFFIRNNELLFFYVKGLDNHLVVVFIEFGLRDNLVKVCIKLKVLWTEALPLVDWTFEDNWNVFIDGMV